MVGITGDWTITISRQKGSFGREIGFLLGERLGYQVVWREVINQAAKLAGAPEAALAAIDEFGLFGFCPSPEACHAYAQAVEQVVKGLADQGRVVIIGRAGQVILHNQAMVFHIRIIAPPPVRADRIAARLQISLAAAQAQIEASDKFRRKYLKRIYQVDWNAPDYYDLVINTAGFRSVQAVELIEQALHQREMG